MLKISFEIGLLLVIFCGLSCADNCSPRHESFLENNYMHTPDSSCFQYIVNDNMAVYLTFVESGYYHCVIKERFADKEQCYNLKLDDAVKYNYIPYYDSLENDLKLTFDDTEYRGKQVSSKFKNIFTLRQQSDKYHKLIESCDDIDELTIFYKKSLFFQTPDSIISKDEKIKVLIKLIEITQVQLVDFFINEQKTTKNMLVLGWISVFNSYKLIKFIKPEHEKIIYSFKKNYEVVDYFYDNWITEKSEQLKINMNDYFYRKKDFMDSKNDDEYIENLINSRRFFSYSKYILDIQKENLAFIIKNHDNIYKEIERCNLFICADYKYSISRLFFFTINFTKDNEVVLTKNFYNKEYLPTTRISNYYLYN